MDTKKDAAHATSLSYCLEYLTCQYNTFLQNTLQDAICCITCHILHHLFILRPGKEQKNANNPFHFIILEGNLRQFRLKKYRYQSPLIKYGGLADQFSDFHTTEIRAVTRIHLDGLTLVDEQRHANFGTRLHLGGLQRVGGGVALQTGLRP